MDHHIAPASAQNTSTLMIASKLPIERTLFELSENSARWIVFCSSMRTRNVLEVRRKASHSTSQETHRGKEGRRDNKVRRILFKLHLRESELDHKVVHGNRSKRHQNSGSSSSTGRRKLTPFALST